MQEGGGEKEEKGEGGIGGKPLGQMLSDTLAAEMRPRRFLSFFQLLLAHLNILPWLQDGFRGAGEGAGAGGGSALLTSKRRHTNGGRCHKQPTLLTLLRLHCGI